MKTALPILIALLLISLAGNFYFWQSARDQERFRLEGNRLNQERINQSLARAKTAAARGDSIQASFENRRASDSLALLALSVRNKAMSDNVQKLRKPVQPLIDSLPALRAFVLANDSLLAKKDELMQQMELRHAAQIIDLEGVIKERGREIMENAKTIEGLKVELTESQGETRQAKRQVKVWKVVGGALVAVVVYLSVKP